MYSIIIVCYEALRMNSKSTDDKGKTFELG